MKGVQRPSVEEIYCLFTFTDSVGPGKASQMSIRYRNKTGKLNGKRHRSKKDINGHLFWKWQPSTLGHKPRLMLINPYFKKKPQTCPNYCIDVHLRAGQMVGRSNWLRAQIQIGQKQDDIVIATRTGSFLIKHYLIEILKHNVAPRRKSHKVASVSLHSHSDMQWCLSWWMAAHVNQASLSPSQPPMQQAFMWNCLFAS